MAMARRLSARVIRAYSDSHVRNNTLSSSKGQILKSGHMRENEDSLQGSPVAASVARTEYECGDLSIYRRFSLWRPDDSGDKSPHSKFPRGQAARGFCEAATKAVTARRPCHGVFFPWPVSAPFGHRATEPPRESFSVAPWLRD